MIGRRGKERKYDLLCVRDRHTRIEKMAATPIPPVYRGHLFYYICASLPIQGFRSEDPYHLRLCRVVLPNFAGSLVLTEAISRTDGDNLMNSAIFKATFTGVHNWYYLSG